MGIGLFSHVTNDRIRGNNHKFLQGGFRLSIGEKFTDQKGYQTLEQDSQGYGGVTISKVFKRYVYFMLRNMN